MKHYEGEDWWTVFSYWTLLGKRYGLRTPSLDGYEVAFKGMSEDLAAFVVNLANSDLLHQRMREAARQEIAEAQR